MFIMYYQYHCCWWPGDARSQGIRSHNIDLVPLKYSSFRARRDDICPSPHTSWPINDWFFLASFPMSQHTTWWWGANFKGTYQGTYYRYEWWGKSWHLIHCLSRVMHVAAWKWSNLLWKRHKLLIMVTHWLLPDFSILLTLCGGGIQQWLTDSPYKGPVTQHQILWMNWHEHVSHQSNILIGGEFRGMPAYRMAIN